MLVPSTWEQGLSVLGSYCPMSPEFWPLVPPPHPAEFCPLHLILPADPGKLAEVTAVVAISVACVPHSLITIQQGQS